MSMGLLNYWLLMGLLFMAGRLYTFGEQPCVLSVATVCVDSGLIAKGHCRPIGGRAGSPLVVPWPFEHWFLGTPLVHWFPAPIQNRLFFFTHSYFFSHLHLRL